MNDSYLWKENRDESTIHEYAVTFNICNNEYINRKRWQNYTKQQQQQQLMRRLKSYVKDIGAYLEDENLVFETSPKTGQQHIHCIVRSSFNIDHVEWSESINLKFSTRGYQTFLAEPIYGREGWKRYLSKNQIQPNRLLSDAIWSNIVKPRSPQETEVSRRPCQAGEEGPEE